LLAVFGFKEKNARQAFRTFVLRLALGDESKVETLIKGNFAAESLAHMGLDLGRHQGAHGAPKTRFHKDPAAAFHMACSFSHTFAHSKVTRQKQETLQEKMEAVLRGMVCCALR
jgi:hypothetical protein